MAKAVFVAKQAFDDGTKKGPSGKAVAYSIGEAYQGDGKSAASLKKKGLICTPAELEASKEQLDEKDKVIRKLESQIEDLKKVNAELQNVVAKLEADLEDAGKAKK